MSVTGHPRDEVIAGKEILRAVGLGLQYPEIISCPTCGRCEVDLLKIERNIRKKVAPLKGNIKIAIMGCVVNGPGEACEADIGIAAGKGA